MRGTTRILGTAALLLTVMPIVVAAPSPSSATAVAPGRFVSGWVPNWSSAVVADGTHGMTGGAQGVFTDVSPFAFTAVSATTIATSGSEASLTAAINAMKANNLPVLPTITDGTGKLAMAAILADPAQRTAHVQAITTLVVGRNYDGIDLDYEGFAFNDGQASWASTRPNWAAFVIELGAALHANGRLLSVTVPPIWNGGGAGYSVYSWQDRNPSLDILPAVDRLRLMVYDWSVSVPGPVSPMTWVDNVLTYVKSVVPADQRHKVQMGVPAYGRSWAKVVSGSCPSNASLGTVGVQMENMGGLLAKPGAVVVRDAASQELKLTYDEVVTGSGVNSPAPPYTPPTNRAETMAPAETTGLASAVRLGGSTCTIRRTVYFPDADTIVLHANAALQAGLSGIVIWALGYETDDVWVRLSAIDVPRPAGTAPIGSLDVAEVVGGNVHIRGWVMDPEFDLPVAFKVSVGAAVSGSIIARDMRADITQSIAAADGAHGFDVVVPIATTQGATVCINVSGYGAATANTQICRPAT